MELGKLTAWLRSQYPTIPALLKKARERKAPRCFNCDTPVEFGVVCRDCRFGIAPHGSKRRVQDVSGIALIATLMVLLLMSGLTAAMFTGAITVTRASATHRMEVEAYYAAEGGAEHALAQLMVALGDGYLADDELAAITPPPASVLPGWNWKTYTAERVDTVRTETITDGPFAGLYARTQDVRIESWAENAVHVADGVVLTAKAQAIPVFQFGVFFEEDLELNNGPPMVFGGRVHTNGNLYVSADSALYDQPLTTPDSIFHDQKHSHDWEDGIWIKDGGGTYQHLGAFDSRFFPDPETFKAESCARFDCRVQSGAFNVDELNVPLPEGMTGLEVIQPRDATDTEMERRAKFAWTADWYVDLDISTLSATGDNICAKLVAASIRPGGYSMPNVPDCHDAFTWTWDAFFDGREGRFVDVLDIDLNELSQWLLTEPDGATSVFYVTLSGTCFADPQNDGCYPIIRLKNGNKINWGPFTFATNLSLYIQGDYNTDEWKPAAVAGDAINILSNAWQDSDQQVLVENPASETWVHTAILAGSTGSTCDHERAGCVSPQYGGGFENFQRFREDWSPGASLVTYHYRGSLVSLHQSAIANAPHGGHYYDPPMRDWAFDTRFEDPANLPPGTPVVGYIVRTGSRPAAY